MTQFDYSGTELGVFQHATNWKRYWAHAIGPYVGEEILDVGAGIGATALNLRERTYRRWVELEPDASLVQEIKALRAAGDIPDLVEVRNGSTSDLGTDEFFDTVLYIDVLEHIEHDKQELLRAMGHVRPGGHVIVVSPAHNYLYSEFDRRIGHFRRYNEASLRQLVPENSSVAVCRYLDSVGMLASLANRLLLKSGSPTITQIKVWDRLMVPVSKRLDWLLGYRLGKSVLCVYRKDAR